MLFGTAIYQVKDCFDLFMMPQVSIIVNTKYFQDPQIYGALNQLKRFFHECTMKRDKNSNCEGIRGINICQRLVTRNDRFIDIYVMNNQQQMSNHFIYLGKNPC